MGTTEEKVIVEVKRLLKPIIIGFAAFLALFTIVGIVSVVTLYSQANDIKEGVQQRCLENNKQDQKQKDLWGFVVALSANNPSQLSPEQQRRQIAELNRYLTEIFKPREC